MARKLVVEIVGDASSLEKSFGKLERKSKSVGSSISKSFVGIAAGVVSVGAAVSVIKSSVEAASNLSEQMNKVNVVFKESGKEVTTWSKTTATGLGIAQDQALEFAGTFGNLLIPMGLARDRAAKMSVGLVKLSADLASFNNANPEEVLQALQSGLSGQIEPLRRFGVFLTQDRIKAFALSKGIVKTSKDTTKIGIAQRQVTIAQLELNKARDKYEKGSPHILKAENAFAQANIKLGKALKGNAPELTQAQKALATYGIILQDTTDAQGDFGRTSGGLANQQRIFAAQMRNLQATIGKAFLPVLLDVVKAANKWLGSTENQKRVQKLVEDGVHALTGAFKKLKDIFDRVWPVLDNIVDKMGGWKTVLGGIAAIGIAGKINKFAGALGAFNPKMNTAAGNTKKFGNNLRGLNNIGLITIPFALTASLGGDSFAKKVLKALGVAATVALITGSLPAGIGFGLGTLAFGAFSGNPKPTRQQADPNRGGLGANSVRPPKMRPPAPGVGGPTGGGVGGPTSARSLQGVHIHGPVTVVANDPQAFINGLQKWARRGSASRSGPYGGIRLGGF